MDSLWYLVTWLHSQTFDIVSAHIFISLIITLTFDVRFQGRNRLWTTNARRLLRDVSGVSLILWLTFSPQQLT